MTSISSRTSAVLDSQSATGHQSISSPAVSRGGSEGDDTLPFFPSETKSHDDVIEITQSQASDEDGLSNDGESHSSLRETGISGSADLLPRQRGGGCGLRCGAETEISFLEKDQCRPGAIRYAVESRGCPVPSKEEIEASCGTEDGKKDLKERPKKSVKDHPRGSSESSGGPPPKGVMLLGALVAVGAIVQ